MQRVRREQGPILHLRREGEGCHPGPRVNREVAAGHRRYSRGGEDRLARLSLEADSPYLTDDLLIKANALWQQAAGCVASEPEILKWQDCLHEAAKYQPDLISAQEVVVQARDTEWSTASSLLPQVTGNLNVSRQQSGGGGSGGDGSSGGVSSGSALREDYPRVSATWKVVNVYLWLHLAGTMQLTTPPHPSPTPQTICLRPAGAGLRRTGGGIGTGLSPGGARQDPPSVRFASPPREERPAPCSRDCGRAG